MAQEGRIDVLFLARNRLYLYNGGDVISLEIPQIIVHDLDVKDRDGLFNLITLFIKDNKLAPAQLYFILSEAVCFIKDIPLGNPPDEAKIEAESKEFIDAIPFSSVVSKTYKVANTMKVIGSNQDLINTIFEAFESKGFGISALVPASIFPDIGIAADLTVDIARIILYKKDEAVAASMVGERAGNTKEDGLATSQNAVPKNKILPYLIPVFAILIIILIVVIFMTR